MGKMKQASDTVFDDEISQKVTVDRYNFLASLLRCFRIWKRDVFESSQAVKGNVLEVNNVQVSLLAVNGNGFFDYQ